MRDVLLSVAGGLAETAAAFAGFPLAPEMAMVTDSFRRQDPRQDRRRDCHLGDTGARFPPTPDEDSKTRIPGLSSKQTTGLEPVTFGLISRSRVSGSGIYRRLDVLNVPDLR